MKMFYEEPNMNITLFLKEDIVTSSGEIIETQTAEEKAAAVLNEKGADKVVAFTF